MPSFSLCAAAIAILESHLDTFCQGNKQERKQILEQAEAEAREKHPETAEYPLNHAHHKEVLIHVSTFISMHLKYDC